MFGRLAVSVLLILGAVGCSGDGEPGEDDLARHTRAAELAALGGVLLTPEASACVDDQTDDDLLTPVVDAEVYPEAEDARAVARAIVDCIGAPAIAWASLDALSGGASADSVTCAAGEFDSELVTGLLASELVGDGDSSAAVQIELARVLGECLTLAELAKLNG